MKSKIAIAGNMIVDLLYSIDKYPKPGELAVLDNKIEKAAGGAGCNNTLDFAKLDPTLPIIAIGQIGCDENGKFILDTLKKHDNIDTALIKESGITSFTAVMNEKVSKQRTFFQFKGANADFSPQDIDFKKLTDVKILHIGYILLLDEFDKPDDKYGTKMAALLAKAQTCGIETSIDVVSSTNGRFSEIMPPALKYTDYCIINEIEAGSTVNVQIRSENGIIESNMITALNKLKTLGVKKWVVIHAPECACGLDCQTGKIIKQASLSLPKNFIKGSTGAGDAFCTGVLYGAYKNKDLAESIKWGTGCAAASLSSVGATDGLGRIDEIIKLYEEMNFQEG